MNFRRGFGIVGVDSPAAGRPGFGSENGTFGERHVDAGTRIISGARIGNYVLDEAVGAGAFAQVWKAHHHERPGRTVAVKIAVEPEFRRQLRREGRLPDIAHPHIVPILDSDTAHDPPYLVMPYYSGGSLADLIRQHPGGLPEDRVEQLLKDVLNGLAELHGRGIVHRDLKPSNILLDENGRAAIADFGLWHGGNGDGALRSMQQSLSVSLDGRPNLAGTIAYMAPEIMDGEAPTASSDVYAVGIVLFELLVGRRPRGVELPSAARPSIQQQAFWNSLYYWACASPEQRCADATALDGKRESPDFSPLRITSANEVPTSGLPRLLPTIEISSLSLESWKALAESFERRESARSSLDNCRIEIEQALEIYEPIHESVRNLREKECILSARIDESSIRIRNACSRMEELLAIHAEPLDRRREDLRTKGYRPNHPDVKAIDKELLLWKLPRGLADREGSSLAIRSLLAFGSACRIDTVAAYNEFFDGALRLVHERYKYPWVFIARRRLALLRADSIAQTPQPNSQPAQSACQRPMQPPVDRPIAEKSEDNAQSQGSNARTVLLLLVFLATLLATGPC